MTSTSLVSGGFRNLEKEVPVAARRPRPLIRLLGFVAHIGTVRTARDSMNY